jgi:hypothetical protein
MTKVVDFFQGNMQPAPDGYGGTLRRTEAVWHQHCLRCSVNTACSVPSTLSAVLAPVYKT